jgi:hypothetical protein
VQTYVVASECFRNDLFLRNTKQCNNFSYISFEIAPVCNCTLWKRLWRCWQHTWKPVCESLLLVCRILNDASSLTKASHPECWYQSREQVKISWSQIRWVWGGCSSIAPLFPAKKSLTNTDRCAGALSWRRNQLLLLNFSGPFLEIAYLRLRSEWLRIRPYFYTDVYGRSRTRKQSRVN